MVAATSPTRLARQILTAAELSAAQQRSDGLAWLALGCTWSIIAGTFALVAMWPTWWTILLALCLIGARQMALAVLMHECAHRTFFRRSKLNGIVGNWLMAAPMNIPMPLYRDVHLRHHRHGGTANDPDLDLVRGYPATPFSLLRKFARDALGITGLKDVASQVIRFELRRDFRFVVFHAALILFFILVGKPWLYGLWWLAYLTAYQIVLRLRLMGEHGSAMDRLNRDPRVHTTTVRAGPLQRLLIAPHGVAYHLEHHLLPSAPIYRLDALHRLLSSKHFFDGFDCLRQNYVQIIRRCVSESGNSHVVPVHGPTVAVHRTGMV
jgi:fatty acid desaturase